MSGALPGGPARSAPAVVGVVVALAAVGSCAFSLTGLLLRQQQSVEAGFPTARGVDIDIGSGNVRIVADLATGVRLEREMTWTFHRPSIEERLLDGTLRIRAGCTAWESQCGVSYVLRVPAELPVRVRTGSGNVQADGVAVLDVRTGSGNAEVRGRTSDVVVRTGSGDLAVTPATSPDRLVLGTGSGDLTVRLPDDEGTAYDVSQRTGSGNADIRIRNDPRSPRTLTARTGSGDLLVAYLR